MVEYPVFLPIKGAGNDDTARSNLEDSIYMMYAEASGEIREIDADEYIIIDTINCTYVCYLTKMGEVRSYILLGGRVRRSTSMHDFADYFRKYGEDKYTMIYWKGDCIKNMALDLALAQTKKKLSEKFK